jgi:hypothetical protein
MPKPPLAASAAALLVLALRPAAAQNTEIKAEGPWEAPGTGMTFPDIVGGYRRVMIRLTNPDSWSAEYSRIERPETGADIILYLYAWRAQDDCAGRFDSKRGIVVQLNPSTKLRSEGKAPSPTGSQADAAMSARYTLNQNGAPSGLEMYQYCKPGSRWWVSYRASWPVEFPLETEAPALMRALSWPADLAD